MYKNVGKIKATENQENNSVYLYIYMFVFILLT